VPSRGKGHIGDLGWEDAEQDDSGSEDHGFTRADQIGYYLGVQYAAIRVESLK
jgi:hypothetical protein